MSNVRVAVTEDLSTTIRNDYQSGNFTQAELAEKHGISVPTVNRVVQGVRPEKRKYTHKTNKFADRNAAIVAKWQEGASTRNLAVEFGVTHQNISLIIAKAGFKPADAHKERLAVRAQVRADRLAGEKQARMDAKNEKVMALSNLWKSGASIGEVRQAAGLNSDNATQVKIVLLRRKYGTDLFPRRPAFGRTANLTAEEAGEKLAKVEKLSALWKAGKTVAECAAEVGWSENTFSRVLPSLRKQYSLDYFPYRRKPATEAAESTDNQNDMDFTPQV